MHCVHRNPAIALPDTWADTRTFRSNFSRIGWVRAGPRSGMMPLPAFRTSGQIARCAIGRPAVADWDWAHEVLQAQSQGHARPELTTVVTLAPGRNPDQHSGFASTTPFRYRWRGGKRAAPWPSRMRPAPLEAARRRCGRARRAARRSVTVFPVRPTRLSCVCSAFCQNRLP